MCLLKGFRGCQEGPRKEAVQGFSVAQLCSPPAPPYKEHRKPWKTRCKTSEGKGNAQNPKTTSQTPQLGLRVA